MDKDVVLESIKAAAAIAAKAAETGEDYEVAFTKAQDAIIKNSFNWQNNEPSIDAK